MEIIRFTKEHIEEAITGIEIDNMSELELKENVNINWFYYCVYMRDEL